MNEWMNGLGTRLDVYRLSVNNTNYLWFADNQPSKLCIKYLHDSLHQIVDEHICFLIWYLSSWRFSHTQPLLRYSHYHVKFHFPLLWQKPLQPVSLLGKQPTKRHSSHSTWNYPIRQGRYINILFLLTIFPGDSLLFSWIAIRRIATEKPWLWKCVYPTGQKTNALRFCETGMWP